MQSSNLLDTIDAFHQVLLWSMYEMNQVNVWDGAWILSTEVPKLPSLSLIYKYAIAFQSDAEHNRGKK